MSSRAVLIPPGALAVTALLMLPLTGGCDLQHTGPAAPAVSPAAPNTVATAPAQVYGCGLPRGPGDGFHCVREEAHFLDQVNNAINATLFQHPEWFEGEHVRDGHVGHYVNETVENLRRWGYCALNDGEEVAVKNSNDFNDQYDIITAGGNVRRAYLVTCRPAWSAIPPAGDGS